MVTPGDRRLVGFSGGRGGPTFRLIVEESDDARHWKPAARPGGPADKRPARRLLRLKVRPADATDDPDWFPGDGGHTPP